MSGVPEPSIVEDSFGRADVTAVHRGVASFVVACMLKTVCVMNSTRGELSSVGKIVSSTGPAVAVETVAAASENGGDFIASGVDARVELSSWVRFLSAPPTIVLSFTALWLRPSTPMSGSLVVCAPLSDSFAAGGPVVLPLLSEAFAVDIFSPVVGTLVVHVGN